VHLPMIPAEAPFLTRLVYPLRAQLSG